jgi:uncharacterized phage protein (TIGR02220 family)
MSKGYIKLNRTDEAKNLFKRPMESHLLFIIALRISRKDNPVEGLKAGEAKIGDYKSFGMSEQNYRTAKKNLSKWGYITTKSTSKGTIARLCNSDTYDLNITTNKEQPNGQSNEQSNERLTNASRTGNEQVTTNKKERIKEDKKEREILPYEKEFFTICDKFKKITGKSIRVQDTPAKIKRSDKYKVIAARLNAGASVEEMIKVIELKFNDWKDNSQMQKYIRLSTFFAPKNYESYLDELDNQTTQPQPETTQSISITDHYKKYYPTKWKFLANSGKLKEYEAKFVDLNFKYSNIAKSHQNPTITAAFIFEAVQTNLNRHLSGSNEQRRIDSLTKWIERDLSDYKRNKADVRNEFFYWTQSKDK